MTIKSLQQRQDELEKFASTPCDLAEALERNVQAYRAGNERLRFASAAVKLNAVTVSHNDNRLIVKCFGTDAWTVDDMHLIDSDGMLDAVLRFLHQ
jgi:hypothetical protein